MNFGAFIYTFIAVLLGLIVPGCALANGVEPQPEQILGSLLCFAVFGSGALFEFAKVKRKGSASFLREKAHLLRVIEKGAPYDATRILLGADFNVVADANGFSLEAGKCRVLDLHGPTTVIRIEVKDSTIVAVQVEPHRINSVSDAISELLNRPKLDP